MDHQTTCSASNQLSIEDDCSSSFDGGCNYSKLLDYVADALELSFVRYSLFTMLLESDCQELLNNPGDVEHGILWEDVEGVASLALADESDIAEVPFGCEDESRDDKNVSEQDGSLLC